MRGIGLLGLLLGLLAGCATPGSAADPLYVGAAKVEITPPVETFDDLNGNGRYDPGEPFRDLNGDGKWTPTWLAGFSVARTALSVHDPLWARAIVFEKGGRRALLVACDLVGYLHPRVAKLRAKIRGVDQVIFASTHVHSGPDTVGLWGPFPGVCGLSEKYLEQLENAVVECASRALEARVPATLVAAERHVDGVCKDIRPPDIRNETAAALLARDPAGRPIAVLVNFAMHPEGMGSKNRAVSSDYPHYLREAVERDFPGAVAVFASGDLGGMQTPDVREHSWEEIRRCGETIAARVREALSAASESSVPEVKFASRSVEFTLDNRKFLTAFQLGTFGKDLGNVVHESQGRLVLQSEVSALRLGDILLVTVPGEAFPEVGKEVFALMDARHRFLIGLGQDEIGYILPKADFDPKKYEESMSLGPETAPTLLDALKILLKGF
jgi:hypothetical protein